MKKIKVKKINTREAEGNFAKLLTENKTYFLNGSWGSGKTEFIKKVEDIYRNKPKKKFIYLDLWNIKDDRSVMNIAFNSFFWLRSIFIKTAVILCVVISLLMTDFINLGLGSVLESWRSEWLFQVFGFVALIVAVWQFFKWRSDDFFNWTFKKKWMFARRRQIKNKVLVVDDFDRVSEDRQKEAYKLFNVLNGKLPIVFLGDFTKISMNKDNYLQKIIDRQIELPHSLHPVGIWNEYFENLEKVFKFKINDELLNLFIIENRNIREQVHFNDYVNLEFIKRGKEGHVQVNQQLLVIYLYLFHKDYYQKLLSRWLPSYHEQESSDDTLLGQLQDSKKVFDSEFDETIFNILADNEEYPPSYSRGIKGYLIFENISNLAVNDAESILISEAKLRNNILKHGSREDDFYSFIISKYREWWPHTNRDRMSYDMRGEELLVPIEIKKIENLVFKLLKNYKRSELTDWVVGEIVRRDISYLYFEDDTKHAEYVDNFFEENYFNDIDLSWKICFYKTYYIMKHKQIYEMFKEQVDSILDNGEKYKLESKKPYLLSMVILNEESYRVNFDEWDETIKAKILKLNDVDFIELWRLYRIINVKYNTRYPEGTLDQIKEIIVYTGYINGHGSGATEIEYGEIIEFFVNKLQQISKDNNIKIYYSNGKTMREEL
jgi:hypothetical protein